MFFELSALIYPINKDVTITLKPVFPVTVDEKLNYSLMLRPFSGLRRYALGKRGITLGEGLEAFFETIHPLKCENGCLSLSLTLPQEDCYLLDLFINGEKVERHEIYALEADLFGKQPFRGDNHMHSYMSDGKDSPETMAAASCKNGCDYCVITDHEKREPSVIAKKCFEATGADFLVIPGEEVHSPDNPVHIINLGGEKSVNDWWRDYESDYRAAVDKELVNIAPDMSPANRYASAACQVMFDKIREVGGVSVLCHPHWIISRGFNEADDVTEWLLDHRRFDALELIAGGAFEDGTQLQISYYHDRETMPILGSSDSHNLFGNRLTPGNFTIAFADDLSESSIKQAILSGMTIAGNQNKLYGEFRLVKYGYFLLRNFYPLHSAQRIKLGSEMLRWAAGQRTPEQSGKIQSTKPSQLFAGFVYR